MLRNKSKCLKINCWLKPSPDWHYSWLITHISYYTLSSPIIISTNTRFYVRYGNHVHSLTEDCSPTKHVHALTVYWKKNVRAFFFLLLSNGKLHWHGASKKPRFLRHAHDIMVFHLSDMHAFIPLKLYFEHWDLTPNSLFAFFRTNAMKVFMRKRIKLPDSELHKCFLRLLKPIRLLPKFWFKKNIWRPQQNFQVTHS